MPHHFQLAKVRITPPGKGCPSSWAGCRASQQFSCPIQVENETKKILLHGCQLHAQKAKSRLDYAGRNQFVLTFTVCHTSGKKKMAISVSSTSFGSAQLTQHKCLHLFPPRAMPLAHTGGSLLTLHSCSVSFHRSHKCTQTDSSNTLPFSGTEMSSQLQSALHYQ